MNSTDRRIGGGDGTPPGEWPEPVTPNFGALLDDAFALDGAASGFQWAAVEVGGRRVVLAGSERGVRRVVISPPEALFEFAVAAGAPRGTLVERAAREVDAYLRGTLDRFAAPVDLDALAPFQRDVLEATRRIPRGAVATYAEVAESIGRPRAVRAVGTALGHNPVPLIVPCHRVVRAGGALGNYSGGGPEMKRWLLGLEGARLAG